MKRSWLMALACLAASSAGCGEKKAPPRERAASVTAPLVTWDEQHRLEASDGTQSDHFGGALDLSFDGGVPTLIVGASHERVWLECCRQNGPGKAYVFALESGGWVERETLLPIDSVSNDAFGTSVARDGDTLAIGAPYCFEHTENQGGLGVPPPGGVYLFEQVGDTWSQTQKIQAADAIDSDCFGMALALEGDVLVVGAPMANWISSDAVGDGAAYVFERNGGSFSESQKLEASNPLIGDRFGASLLLDGATLVIGAPNDDAPVLDAGSIYRFTRSGGVWTEQERIGPATQRPLARYGRALARTGDTVFVGGETAGEVEVFDTSGGVWTLQQTIVSPSLVDTSFGSALAASGDTLLVGARHANVGLGLDRAGAAHLFRARGATWTVEQTLVASVPYFEEWFGDALAIGPGLAVVGALNDDELDPNVNQGSAYAFALVGEACSVSGDCGGRQCVDGYCCDTPCDRSCERCDVAGQEGQCSVLPHGHPGSPVCEAFVCHGSEPVCPSSCNFDSDCAPNAGCELSGETGVCVLQGDGGAPCGEARDCNTGFCVDGVCCQSACDGACEQCDAPGEEGRCALRQPGDTGACFPFACDGTNVTCPEACDADTQCAGAEGYICDLATHLCSNSPVCDGDHSIKNPDGSVFDCGHYRCNSANVCNAVCDTSADCAQGSVCNADGQCVAAPDIVVSQSCDCSFERSPSRTTPWALWLTLACVRRRRRVP